MLFVVPPLLDKILQSVNPDILRRSLSSVRLIISGAVGLNDSIALRVLQLLPKTQLLQGNFIQLLHVQYNINTCIMVMLAGWAKKVSLFIFAINLSTARQFS